MVTKKFVNKVFNPLYMKGGIHSVLSAYRNDDFSFVKSNLEKIISPVLIIWRNHDIVHTKAVMEKTNKKISNCKLVTLKDTGHLLHEEKAAAFNKTTKEFLEESHNQFKSNLIHLEKREIYERYKISSH